MPARVNPGMADALVFEPIVSVTRWQSGLAGTWQRGRTRLNPLDCPSRAIYPGGPATPVIHRESVVNQPEPRLSFAPVEIVLLQAS